MSSSDTTLANSLRSAAEPSHSSVSLWCRARAARACDSFKPVTALTWRNDISHREWKRLAHSPPRPASVPLI